MKCFDTTDLGIFWIIPNVQLVNKDLELLGVGIARVGGC